MARRSFFKRPIQAGRAVSQSGLAAGLNALDEAVRSIEIAGGEVVWRGNRPTLIPGDNGGTHEVYVLRKATAEDASGGSGIVVGQWLLSRRMVSAGDEIDFEPTEPITCPVVD